MGLKLLFYVLRLKSVSQKLVSQKLVSCSKDSTSDPHHR